MTNIYISHAYFQPIYRYLEQRQLLHVLTPEHLSLLISLKDKNPLEKASLALFNCIIKNLETAQISTTLYLDIAQEIEIKHFGLVGYISSHAENLFEAAKYIEKYGTLMIESQPEASIHLKQNNIEAMITWPHWQADCTALNEINLFAIHRMIQQFVAQDHLKYLRIEVAHAPCIPEAEYKKLFQTKIIFNTSHYAFVFAKHSLDTLLPQPDDMLVSLLSQQAEQWLSQQQPLSLKHRIESVLLHYLEQGQPIPEIHQLANTMHLSTRSFQRKLAEENIVYRQLIEQLRMQVCMQLLRQKRLSLSEIALQLGYADQSSLGRAFKKRYGYSMTQLDG